MDRPTIRILSGSPLEVEQQLNELVSDYAIANFVFSDRDGTVVCSAMLVERRSQTVIPVQVAPRR